MSVVEMEKKGKLMNTMRSLLWSVVAVVAFFATDAAAQLNNSGSFRQESPATNRSVRALGMGNAAIALPGDLYSPFYNPAALNDIEETKIAVLNPTLEITKSAFSLIGDTGDLIDAIDDANNDSEKVQALDDFVSPRFGQFNHLRAALNIVNFVTKNFGAGVIIEERLTFSFRDQTFPTFDVRNITDVILYGSIAHNFWDKLLQVGLTFRPTIRTSVNEKIDTTTAINDEVDDVFKTLKYPHIGFGFDAGIKSDLSLPILMEIALYEKLHKMLNPAVALTWQDIGNTPFKINVSGDGSGEGSVNDAAKFANAVSREPVRNEQSISFGMAVSPKIWILDTAFAVDIRGLNRRQDFVTKLNLGAEVKIPWKVLSAAVRAGVSQGYPTVGASIDLWLLELDLATYAEEIGVFGSRQGSRRYAVRVGAAF